MFFRSVDHPCQITKLPPVLPAQWYTWSNHAREVFSTWLHGLKKRPKPRIIRLLYKYHYNYKFLLKLADLEGSHLFSDALGLARTLYEMEMPDHIMLLTEMMDERIGGPEIRFLFAFLREALALFSSNPYGALYTPLRDVGRKSGAFPLHVDLYGPVFLLNVFEEVPKSGGGDSKFLSRESLFESLDQTQSL
jgi:hypothetical protein